MSSHFLLPCLALPAVALVSGVLLLGGCGSPNAATNPPRAPAASPATAKKAQASTVAQAAENETESGNFPVPGFAPVPEPAAPVVKRERRQDAPLADLLANAEADEQRPPVIDEARTAAAGIRKLSGRHIDLYTDLPAGEGDELPQVFDAAVPLWCAYFDIGAERVRDWRAIAWVMRDKERFVGAGVYPESLPDFPHGYSVGPQVWLFDQPSEYYRRHLLLHEGTHCFMSRWLGGAGPPWYMEGIAELLGTHRWEGGKLTLGIMPRDRDEVPYWGRVKIVRDEYAAGRGMSLTDIMKYDTRAHLRNEPYGWCWAAAAFLDQHPQTQPAFRDLRKETKDRTIEFSKRFYQRLKDDWPGIQEDWQLFVRECDYGYDVARAATIRKAAAPLPPGGITVNVLADRGWQSSGILLEGGKTYAIRGQGRFDVASGEKPWPCEAGGITLHYHDGKPLGMLLAAVSDDLPAAQTPLANPIAIGLSSTLSPTTSGTLYLRINEAASGLEDNRGGLQVKVEAR